MQVCWPFNTYIIPADNYTLDIQAEDVVLGAINLNVTDDGTLELWTEGDFQTPYPVIAIVRLYPNLGCKSVGHYAQQLS